MRSLIAPLLAALLATFGAVAADAAFAPAQAAPLAAAAVPDQGDAGAR